MYTKTAPMTSNVSVLKFATISSRKGFTRTLVPGSCRDGPRRAGRRSLRAHERACALVTPFFTFPMQSRKNLPRGWSFSLISAAAKVANLRERQPFGITQRSWLFPVNRTMRPTIAGAAAEVGFPEVVADQSHWRSGSARLLRSGNYDHDRLHAEKPKVSAAMAAPR